jgi:hypothetical protein
MKVTFDSVKLEALDSYFVKGESSEVAQLEVFVERSSSAVE